MLNTSACFTEDTYSLHYKYTPVKDAVSKLVQARGPSLTQRQAPANTEPAYITLKYVAAATNDVCIQQLSG